MHSAVDLERELVRFVRTARGVGLRAADVLSPGLEQSGYALVVAIERLGHAHACELADLMGLDKSTVSRLLASLDHRELIERTTDPADRRAHVVSLSDHGRARLAAARYEHSADLAHALADWSPEEIDDAVRVIARLSDGLSAPRPPRTTKNTTANTQENVTA
jgi:DNA-binding MarR family transcriptional regulator